jgi:hypothetical protein
MYQPICIDEPKKVNGKFAAKFSLEYLLDRLISWGSNNGYKVAHIFQVTA